jgi:hypothetical protein
MLRCSAIEGRGNSVFPREVRWAIATSQNLGRTSAARPRKVSGEFGRHVIFAMGNPDKCVNIPPLLSRLYLMKAITSDKPAAGTISSFHRKKNPMLQ